MFLLWLRQLSQCGDQTSASVPPPAKGRSHPTNTTVLSPSSSILPSLCGSIYSFLLVRNSCPLSAGVLHALLGLMVYSWGEERETCTPCLSTPPLSSKLWVLTKKFLMQLLGVEKNIQFLRKCISSFCFIVFTGLEADNKHWNSYFQHFCMPLKMVVEN